MANSNLDSTMREVFPAPSPNDGSGKRGVNNFPSVSKPESNDRISSVFYDPIKGNPGTLDSTMDHPLEISFED